jgi:hypothetical protein
MTDDRADDRTDELAELLATAGDDPLPAALGALRAVRDRPAPAPSPELAALLRGSRAPARRRRAGRLAIGVVAAARRASPSPGWPPRTTRSPGRRSEW